MNALGAKSYRYVCAKFLVALPILPRIRLKFCVRLKISLVWFPTLTHLPLFYVIWPRCLFFRLKDTKQDFGFYYELCGSCHVCEHVVNY